MRVNFTERWCPLSVAKMPPAGDVHVWRVSIDRGTPSLTPHLQSLDTDEQQRAKRFHFLADAVAYVRTRATLRCLLGQMLQIPPTAVRFQYNHYGKPSLKNAPYLTFSVSHSADLALIA